MVQLKDFFLKLWFHSLEVVILSRIRGLALFPYSWSLCWGGRGGASCHEQHVNWHRLSGINSLLSGVFKVFNSLALSALRFLAPARSPPTVGYHKKLYTITHHLRHILSGQTWRKAIVSNRLEGGELTKRMGDIGYHLICHLFKLHHRPWHGSPSPSLGLSHSLKRSHLYPSCSIWS